jgi:tetratricopeptide (TPR) repeat protein
MADLSPEFASEIQKLEANYASNPGRFFVPLASKWRDAGDVAMAERILRENIGKFPGLSAHVLLGRCLADRGAFPEAANEFHYVLSIDSQNLIALRTLAEMAAAMGRRGDAERWYNELLAVDPMNAEARAALQELARTPAAPAPPAPPAERGWGDLEPAPLDTGAQAHGGEFGMIDLSAPDASPADASGVAADDATDGAEWGDLVLDAPDEPAAPAPSAAAADGGDFDAFGFGSVDLDADAAADAPSSPASAGASAEWMDLDARQDVGESAAEDAGALPLLDDGMIDAPLAGADLPLLNLDEPDDSLAASASQPGAGFGFGEPAAGSFDDVGYVAHEQDGHDADAEMVTETMAELYASQGLLAQAADVYRELIGQRGQEPGLVRRLAEIEARMEPEGTGGSASPDAFPSFAAGADADETPDWLQSVDAFARGGAEPTLDADVPGLDISPAQTDETLVAESEEAASEFPEFAATDDFPSYDPGSADDLPLLEPSDDFPSFAPAAADDASGGLPSFGGTDDLPSFAPPADDALPSFEPAADFAPAAGFSLDAADAAPELAETSASADPFADSFAGGFDGAADVPSLPEPAFASIGESSDDAAGDDRQPWQPPSVAETEPVGFDILVVADEDGAEVPAPADVVADMSADWAMAAAPLDDDDDEEDEAESAASIPEPVHAAPAFTAPAIASPATAGGRTMRGYFDSLLAWQPVPAEAPTYELSAEGGAITIEAAAPEVPAHTPAPIEAPGIDAPPAEAPAPDAEPLPYESPEPEPLPYESPEPEPLPYQSPDAEPLPYEAPEAAAPSFDAGLDFPAAPAIPAFDAPSFQPPAPAFAEPAAQADDEPWAAAAPAAEAPADEPWAMPGESAPAAAAEGAPEDLPLLDLDEPWAESPAAPREPVDIGAFELADDDATAAPIEPAPAQPAADAGAEELLPWEVPADPAAAPAPAPVAEPAAGGFSFEDFFAGAPAEPAAPVPQPEAAAPPAAPEPEPFRPSFGEPTPPPTFEDITPGVAYAAPAPPPAPAAPAPAPAAPAAAAGQDEEDEDLESFQAWLQSLKR